MNLFEGGYIVCHGEGFVTRGPITVESDDPTRIYFVGDDKRWTWRDRAVFAGTKAECDDLAKLLTTRRARFMAKIEELNSEFKTLLVSMVAAAEALQ